MSVPIGPRPIVPGNADTLLRQASMTAELYMQNAKDSIDKTFGEGYASKHPDLVAAFMKTAAADFHTGLLVKCLDLGLDSISDSLGYIAAQGPRGEETE